MSSSPRPASFPTDDDPGFEVDLSEVDGSPTPEADHAYARHKSDIVVQANLGDGTFQASFSGTDRSPIMAVIALSAPVLPASQTAIVLNLVGLGPVITGIAAGVVWTLGTSAAVVFLVRNRRG